MRRLRRWSGRAVGDVEFIQLGDDRAREQPAGAQVGEGAAQQRGSLSRATEQLDRLHRHEAQRKVAPIQLERTRVYAYGLHRQIASPAL